MIPLSFVSQTAIVASRQQNKNGLQDRGSYSYNYYNGYDTCGCGRNEMKAKQYFAAAAVGMFTLGPCSAMAFHDGGVARCSGCHSMHNSADNLRLGDGSGASLIVGTDASSTCLNCHKQGGHQVFSTDGSAMTSGGDFFWLTDAAVDYKVGSILQVRQNRGHNVVAADFNIMADTDPDNAFAPGSTTIEQFVAADLGCTSCHDAHGQVQGGTRAGVIVGQSGSYGAPPLPDSVNGNFRLLGDTGYRVGGRAGEIDFAFAYPAPVARAADGSYAITRYGSGMSEWCANCHGDFLGTGTTGVEKHPAGNDQLLGELATNYNGYIRTGEFDAGRANGYDDLVPFETGDTDNTQMAAPVSGVGPAATAGANVMCLTCHRAHASAFNNAGRWPFDATLIVEETFHNEETPALPVAFQPFAMYKDGASADMETNYGLHQRSLCNKCHVQD
jgi:hypothetical protein